MSGTLAVLITWISLALAYYTPYPVSFYVTGLAFVLYIAARAATAGGGLGWRLAPPWHRHRGAAMRASGTATVRM